MGNPGFATQFKCSTYIDHAFNLLLLLLDAQRGPVHLLLLMPQLLQGLFQQLPVPYQLILLRLQLCLLLAWAQGNPVHHLPCPGHYLTSSQALGSDPGELLTCATLGCGAAAPGIQAVSSCTHLWGQGLAQLGLERRTRSFPRKGRAPHHVAHPRTCSRHGTLSAVQIPSPNVFFSILVALINAALLHCLCHRSPLDSPSMEQNWL